MLRLFIVAYLLLILIIGTFNFVYAKYVCADFSTCQQAKSVYQKGAKYLDRDKDGVPCESLCFSSKTSMSASNKYILGPKGGCYYITGTGKKKYVSKNLCH